MFNIEKEKIDNGEVNLMDVMDELTDVPVVMEIALQILARIDDNKPGIDDECDAAISELYFFLNAIARYFEMLEPLFTKYYRYEYDTENLKKTINKFTE